MYDLFVWYFFVGGFVDVFVVDVVYCVVVELVEVEVVVVGGWIQCNGNVDEVEVDGVFLDYVRYGGFFDVVDLIVVM